MKTRQHTVTQSSEFVPTRLFRLGSASDSSSGISSDEVNLKVLPEEKIFGRSGTDFLGPPPKESVYAKVQLFNASLLKKKAEDNLATWITVFCVDNRNKAEVIDFLEQFGEISKVEPPITNFMAIEFVKKASADKVVSMNQPILINNTHAIICKLGKYRKPLNTETLDDCPVPSYDDTNHGITEARLEEESTIPQAFNNFINFLKWTFY